MKNKIRNQIKEHFHLYDIEDLIIEGNCGCCGAWIPDEVFPKHWRWGLCKKCIKGE